MEVFKKNISTQYETLRTMNYWDKFQNDEQILARLIICSVVFALSNVLLLKSGVCFDSTVNIHCIYQECFDLKNVWITGKN